MMTSFGKKRNRSFVCPGTEADSAVVAEQIGWPKDDVISTLSWRKLSPAASTSTFWNFELFRFPLRTSSC
ncbi:hypothetical protein M758_3G000500 [Ceratodon purpureus]|uniref:Uncharacterized protein n=1 Tax=Ceratodon purpureus TaxID=3225 RepID=A0A8T0IGQ1_CERPU|nr:hypothetical protein KC19_3G003100 [Ceratodon purpureus]KAG0621185.1 hypothetical protein M758_3G000500 [Ceratodon purpureus]